MCVDVAAWHDTDTNITEKQIIKNKKKKKKKKKKKSADPSPEPLGPRSQVQFGCEITGTLGGKLIH